MFFEHGDFLFPLSDIKSCKTKNGTTTVVLRDGPVLKSEDSYTSDHIAAMAAPSVPASPGYYKISVPKPGHLMDNDSVTVPIVAWRIIGECNFALPITIEIDECIPQDYAVLCPNGKVHRGFTSYKSITDFFQAMNSREATDPSQGVQNGSAACHGSQLVVKLKLDRATSKEVARPHREQVRDASKQSAKGLKHG